MNQALKKCTCNSTSHDKVGWSYFFTIETNYIHTRLTHIDMTWKSLVAKSFVIKLKYLW